MNNIERRLAVLEQRSGLDLPEHTIFVQFIDPANPRDEERITGYRAGERTWSRVPGESIEDLRSRAQREARVAGHVLVLIEQHVEPSDSPG